MPLTLAANTYPQQTDAIMSAASAALLITNADTPDAEVARVADFVFEGMPARYPGSADVVRVSPQNERRGITIPMHPGTARRGLGGGSP
jgi:TRAP-type uncharacterized transport system substrate-binding protein